ncbi:class I SAM-dependent methyltransferase [Mangrovicoccus sp. HB161399]|uniref:class I SAM-dependent methyltransferase n=1 Tax=Mangrovicoccus sp. HB161399 TaxID=2720392 RepID=UPI00155461B0|nr:class I SAM-dependent methyltransferase [Mangrovicoccus sp. HB161399]
MAGIRERLGLEDPFASYVHDPGRADRQGWNSSHPFLEAALREVEPRLVIELGVWKGMSAIHMGGLLQRQGNGAEILAIDTWLGSAGHLAAAGRRAELAPVDGYPTLYRTFLANVFEAGLQQAIVPLPMDGHSAARALAALGVTAGVIHVDASHDHAACLSDLRGYWPLLEPEGILVADDYGTWPGVTRAVCEFAAEVGRPVFGSMGKALLPKAEGLGFELKVARARRRRGAAMPHRRPAGAG